MGSVADQVAAHIRETVALRPLDQPARLRTVEQQVTPEILFTYITDVSSTSTQLIRVEWAFNPNWSAILIREENGYVGLDFAYKKRFK